MRKLLIGLLILGGVIAAIAVMKRRSGSGVDEWDSFTADDCTRRHRTPPPNRPTP